MKPSVYIETSVIRYYCNRESKDPIIFAKQEITKKWWKNSLPNFQGFISPIVVEEIQKGDLIASKRRIESIFAIPILKQTPEIFPLAELIFADLKLPDKSKQDILHISFAIVHSMDFLLSWNCRHIANGWVIKQLDIFLKKRGLNGPTICTPDEL